MILDNHVALSADPDAVFALINDVERVASCLPGAVLDGQEDDTYLGRVTFKVGPISAAYSGKVRFTEVAAAERRLRLSARGADSHGTATPRPTSPSRSPPPPTVRPWTCTPTSSSAARSRSSARAPSPRCRRSCSTSSPGT